MRKLAAWCHDRRRTVIGLWVAAFVVSIGLWATAAGEFVNNFSLPGTESQRTYDLLKERFPAQSGDTASVVFAVDQGRVLDNRAEIEAVRAEIAKSPEVLAVGDPFAEGAPVSQDGRITFAQIQLAKGAGEADPAAIKTMAENTLELDGQGGVQVALGGDIIHWSTAETGGAGEIFGILVAALVLFLTLGVVAMGLPLLNALFAMVVSLSLMAVVGTQVLDVVDWTPQLAAMIGIGVGIDYALLILNRFRLERGGGRDVRDATLIALDTSGRAVLFAGIVVVIAMLGMMLLGISFLYGPAIGAALAVLATMVAALTLMPAILGTRIGRRIKVPTAPNGNGDGTDLADRETGFAARWSRFVARRPLPVAILALAVLITLALPALHMRLATSDASTYKKDDTARIAYDLLKEGFGPGFNAPLLLAVELPKAGDQAALQQISNALSEQDGIAQVLPPQLNEAGDTATMIAYPTTTPQDERTDETVKTARSETLPPVAEQTGARISIGGTTASNLDFSQTIRDKLPLFIGVVVGLSLLLLAVVFRSLLIPVKAGIFNLLSIAGAFGVVTLIFQDGNFAGLFGDATGPIESFLPIMVFAVVFGLSMDYEVFLVSRMHEEWVHTGDARYAVRHGLAMTGRVVTAAAIIMIAVFGAFAIGNERALAMMGVGFASAIFIDAFIIRLLLLPAVMHLAGPAMWWMPAWLDKRLPHFHIERPDADDELPAPEPEREVVYR